MTYRLVLPPDCDPQLLLPKLRLLEEEDPQLHLDWDAENREIHARLMGQVRRALPGGRRRGCRAHFI